MAEEITHGQNRIPGQHVINAPLDAIPEDAWVTLGIGDHHITQNPLDKARMKSVLQFFLDDNPGTDIKFAMVKISHLLNSLGAPQLGLNRLDQMYKYVTIQRSIKKK